MACVCQECGIFYKIDIITEDGLWNEIKPEGKENGAGLLCGMCIVRKLENNNKYNAFKLVKIAKSWNS